MGTSTKSAPRAANAGAMAQEIVAPMQANRTPLEVAQSTFAAVIAAGIDARLEVINVEADPEYSVVLGDGFAGHGLIHEQVVELVAIAEAHGARLFLQNDDLPCIVWPLSAGSVGPGTHEDRPASLRTKVEAHNGRPRSRRKVAS